ncbi:glycosyltransferase family 9 protein [cf. Phormidesmis sp. LEGE 11477]|uniref:glycosyltransferase family 9 protein n=1 Tax=cf. Phormidesmis sp. LEGE 11477 TaxID=1828680 RepID=UPI00187EB652|nr:glycosyltransferase family 9 protein [cf. Phormidesmis sp. LEGE 11477]MBE9063326.1 glycosyltransferase family 9 protein [cf. Phormidesmis sp. LEGE 11477]
MRILAIVPGGISDQLLFFPALEDIKRVYPNAEISVVAEPKASSAYRVSKIVDTVIPFTFSAANSPSDWANLLGNVRDREYEVVLTTDLSWSMGLLLWLSGVPTRVTFEGTSAPYFYTRVLPDSSQSSTQYQADRYHDLLLAIGIEGPAPALSVNVPEGDLNWAKKMRDRQGLASGYVLMYPGPDTGSADVGARFSVPSWQTVIADFREKQPQMPIVLLQTEGSIPQINALRVGDDKLVVANTENIGQAAAVIAGADLLLTPDSYVMQLSAALKVFTLALFGKNSPEEMLPPTKGEETRFLGIASETSKIADISPETVLNKVWGR